MTDIFVSYARQDRDRVAKLVAALEQRGWSVWWDPTIAFGSDYAEAIERALRASRCVLVVWSESSIGSHWVREEAAVGRSRGTLIPIRIDEVAPPIGFRSLQTADLIGWDFRASPQSEKLLAEIERLLEDLRQPDSSPRDAEPAAIARAPIATASAKAPTAKGTAPRSLSARLPWALGAALIAAAAIALWVWLGRRGPAPEPPVPDLEPGTGVAVLPFENLTGSEELSYVATGLSAGLVGGLADMPGVNVVSRSRAQSALAAASSPAAAAEALSVNLLVEGEVHAGGREVEVDVTVSEGSSGAVLWSRRFEGARDDLLALQYDIESALARVFSVPLSESDRRRLSSLAAGGPPARAFRFYLQGLERLDDVGDPRHAEFAADLFRQAILIDGDFAVFHAALSDAIWAQHLEGFADADLAEAEDAARRALELDPQLAQAHLALARAVRGRGQVAESIAALRPLLADHPKPDEAFRELAFGYEYAGDLAAAEECYQTAVALGPENWFNWNAQGAFLAKQGRMREAAEALERAIELAPESVFWPRLNLGGVKVMTGDNQGAIEQFEAAGMSAHVEVDGPRTRPATASLANNMANAYYYSGRLDEALALFGRVVELEPGNHVYRRNLGDVLLEAGRRDEARAEFRRARALVEEALAGEPRNGILLSALALYAAKLEDCEAAVGQAREGAEILAGGFQNHINLAGAFALCGRRDEAIGQIRACLESGLPGAILRQQAELASLLDDPEFLELTADASD
jgi:tetratricopeptide (TPR) repeat protein